MYTLVSSKVYTSTEKVIYSLQVCLFFGAHVAIYLYQINTIFG